jgi:hypothetical protein
MARAELTPWTLIGWLIVLILGTLVAIVVLQTSADVFLPPY